MRRLTKILYSRASYTRRPDSTVGYSRKLVRRIRETGSTGCIIRNRLYFIILLSAIIGY